MAESRVKVIEMEGEVLSNKTLKDLQKQAGHIDDFDELEIMIASPGGDVSEGIKEMVWANALTEMGKKVSTIVTANAYSIASLMMLSASKGQRKISRTAKVMVHNPMKPELTHVNANDLEAYVLELRNLEEKMYEMYGLFTGLDRETIKNLMDNETYLSADEAVKYGFADEVVDLKERPDAQAVAVNNEKKINMKSTLNILNSVIAMVTGKEFVNQSYYDTLGGSVEIYQADPSKYSTGDKTNVESGERTLLDGSTVVIENYTITDIKKGMEAPEDFIDPAIEKPAVVQAVDPIEVIPTNDEPEVETAAIDPEKVEIADPALPVKIEIEPVEDKALDTPNSGPAPEDPFVKMQATIEAMAKTQGEMQNTIDTLMKASAENIAKFEAQKAFENLATEAIDVLAKNTTSNFAPEARPTVTIVSQTGSIFSRLKEQAQASKK